jgi:uncharacterized protein (DUF433 family)
VTWLSPGEVVTTYEAKHGPLPEPRTLDDEHFISIDPRRHSGSPCINLTRTSTSAIAGCVYAGDSVESTMDGYGGDRTDVLLACWYEATFNPRQWSKWKRWAEDAWGPLARSEWDQIPDPPLGVTS